MSFVIRINQSLCGHSAIFADERPLFQFEGWRKEKGAPKRRDIFRVVDAFDTLADDAFSWSIVDSSKYRVSFARSDPTVAH